ncbi:hypothetical protein [Candidatus Colwellia aromaticivorans]|uniref:hypothetical protein n=1 Tax=Candidatus Colwellia aromaticivorans TaxID=2267621 RepID=UPI000DF1F9BD|nr:hypothetical protein [Candidatus Colwellia aromaticivorans]
MSTIELPENNNNLNKSKSKKSRRSLFMVLAAFALPIILAKLALEQQWLDMGVTNKGTLLTNELTLEQLGLKTTDFEQHWLILYNLPEHCSIDCQKTFEAIHNTYVALGKEMPRVFPVALYQNELSGEQRQKISESKWQLLAMPEQAKQHLTKPQIFIVDPLGNVFLSHQLPENTEQLPQLGKQILADMKKLLKYSKVG